MADQLGNRWAFSRGFSDCKRILLQASGRRHLPGKNTDAAFVWSHASVCVDGADTTSDLSPVQITAIHIAERLLGRGLAPTVDAECCAELPPRAGRIIDWAGDHSWKSPDGSDAEAHFISLLPKLLRPDLFAFVHFQVPLDALAQDGSISHQRVDFLLLPPHTRGRGIVIEIDGSGHRTDDAARDDSLRDQRLRSAGHEVVRVPTADISDLDSPSLRQLKELFDAVPPVPASDDPAVAATQVAATILLLLRLGRLKPGAETWRIRVTGDYATSCKAGIRLAHRALRATQALYGARVVPDDIIVQTRAAAADLVIEWDCSRPWYASTRFSTRGAARVVVRPTYLPGLAPIELPSVEWAPPNPQVDEEHLITLLRLAFPAHSSFRAGQLVGVRRLLSGADSIVLLPTGAGKSLIYQLSALLMPGLTLVVSPLVALIEDQVANLRRMGMDRVISISSRTTAAGKTEAVQEHLASGCYAICYVSPERLQIQSFRDSIFRVRLQMPIPSVIVDEAHCVSEWGHDFRPAYLNLGRLGRALGRRGAGEAPAVVGLTGTASRAVLRDLQRELNIRSLDAVITPESFDRRELTFEVIHASSNQKQAALEGVLSAIASRLGQPSQAFWSNNSATGMNCGIVFCPHAGGQFGVERVAERIASAHPDLPISTYSGKLDQRQQQRTAHDFRMDRVQILVATKAFGMGIDKPNVRFTVHYGFPQSLEAYYQEAGRAGRDGRRAHCVVLASVDDRVRAQRLLNPATPVTDIAPIVQDFPTRPDDITRGLWFHTNSFAGVDVEVRQVEEFISHFQDLGRAGEVAVRYEDNERSTHERVLHRLLTLGLCDDYTVDYSHHRINVCMLDTSGADVGQKLMDYVRAYSPARADEVMRQHGQAFGSLGVRDATLSATQILTEFIYSTIELARRAALRQVWDWCERGRTDSELRRLLLDYLQETEFSREIERLLHEAEFELAAWSRLFDDMRSMADLRAIEGALRRAIPDYPDHPTVNGALSVVTALRSDGDPREVADYARAACEFLQSRFQSQLDGATFRRWLWSRVGSAGRDCRLAMLGVVCDGHEGQLLSDILQSATDPAYRVVALQGQLRVLVEEARLLANKLTD